jgi:hypothetical protein
MLTGSRLTLHVFSRYAVRIYFAHGADCEQVLINLTTNAIKFTTSEEMRTIKVILSASRERPSASPSPCVSYFQMRAKRMDQTLGPDWGDGEEIYLEFAVQDTGRGLSPEELKVLFQRFQQASPRTHVQYGGSGLGLFISRELTELQGGEIGVSSQAGKGSTFAFYVKCRRSHEPSEAVEGATGISLARKPSSAKDKERLAEPPKIKDFAAISEKTTSVAKTKPQWRDLKVLIVEDNLGASILSSTRIFPILTCCSQPKSPPTATAQPRHCHQSRQSRRRSS